MEFTTEMLEKAKTAKTAEELLELAKAENVDMTAEEAAKYFADIHKSGELSDEELENAAGGGGCGSYESGQKSRPEECVYLAKVGQEVYVSNYPMFGWHTDRIVDRKIDRYLNGWAPYYGFRQESGKLYWIVQEDIAPM